MSDHEASAEAASGTIPFCPHEPWPKQQTFLDLDCLEAFYGGAAAGGKSEALLMAALQYVHVPGYAALILRKDVQRMRLSGGLIPRSMEWLAQSDAKWNNNDRRWTFPTSGANSSISFGFLRDWRDKYRYGSSEFQFIAFDELTEFSEEDYTFLFSRLRRSQNVAAPLRMRAASNPGNTGHNWVLQRFISPEAQRWDDAESTAPQIFWNNGIAYLPARIRDNPAMNEEEYRASLLHLPPVHRERLMNGDWTIREEGLIRHHWLARYMECDGQLRLLDAERRVIAQIDERDCRRFVTVDPAGTSADIARERRGKPPSYTVLQVWDQPGGEWSRYLFLRHVVRERVGFDGLCGLILDCSRRWNPEEIYVEAEKLGAAAVTMMVKQGLPIITIATEGKDKVTRASSLFMCLERGEVRLPIEQFAWMPALEAEWLSWTGAPDDVSDQIDTAAYAAILASKLNSRKVKIEPVVMC